MTDHLQNFIFSKDHFCIVGNHLNINDIFTLKKVSKSIDKVLSRETVLSLLYTRLQLLGETVPALLDANNPKPMVDFNQALDRIKKKQQAEFSFLGHNHCYLTFLKMFNIYDFSLQQLEYNHHLLNQYNAEIIHQSILRQPGKTLNLANLTRFIITHEDEHYFEELEHLYFSRFNLLNILHIKNLNNLKILKCGSNKLTTLCIQNLPEMVKLHCHDNKSLTTLVLRELPVLKKLAFSYCPSLRTLHLEGLPSVKYIYTERAYSFEKITDLNIQGVSGVIQKLLASTKENLHLQKCKKVTDYSLPSTLLKPEDAQEDNIILNDFTNLKITETAQQKPPVTYQPLYQHVQAAPAVSYHALPQNRFDLDSRQEIIEKNPSIEYPPVPEKQFLPQRQMLPQRQVYQSSENTHIGTSMSKNSPS